MATNGAASTQHLLSPVVQAVESMQGNATREVKEKAVEFLDQFQKQVRYPRLGGMSA
jgi:hypothetical protein